MIARLVFATLGAFGLLMLGANQAGHILANVLANALGGAM
jgi:hypothetical protein